MLDIIFWLLVMLNAIGQNISLRSRGSGAPRGVCVINYLKNLERWKFFPVKFAVRAEVFLTLWAETNTVKVRKYGLVSCISQALLVAILSDLVKPETSIEATVKGILVNTRSRMVLRVRQGCTWIPKLGRGSVISYSTRSTFLLKRSFCWKSERIEYFPRC